MEYAILAVIAVIGGGLVGWTSASNMDKNPLTTPMVFHKISPLYFIGAGFIIPAYTGYRLVGMVGIFVSLFISWLASVIIGSTIHGKK